MRQRLLIDTDPVGTYNQGDCWEDTNGNNSWDADRGSSGMGGADDIVRYQVSITYPRLVPIWKFLGTWGTTDTVTSNTVLRNQPYAGRSISNVVRCS